MIGIATRNEQVERGAGAANVAARLRAFASDFDHHFAALVAPAGDAPVSLVEAVRYAALAPGKRIRPYLLVRSCELCGGDASDAWHAGAAIECVHAFSLVHDDLPAMDDDDLRRGQPTCHRKFGEATAILAGDALIVLAFELIVRRTPGGTQAAELVSMLAKSTGWCGMIGGQTADVLGEGQPQQREAVEYIHERKTACLFECACRMGAQIGRGDAETADRLARFGKNLGRAFQIADDLLDLTATTEALGKAVGKDVKAGKQTYPACVGSEESRSIAEGAAKAAVETLEPFGATADDLRELARFVVNRTF